jgi:cell division protein FtsL
MARRATSAAARTAAPAHRPTPRRQPRRSAPPPRRRSGPARVVALPLRIARAPAGRSLRGRIAGVADSLLHGRGWIALVAVLLVGIVFFNVDLLQMNRDIAQTADRAATVKRDNAQLKLRLARLASAERIQQVAQQRGLVLPLPGQIRYLRAHGAHDGLLAAKRMSAPDKGQDATPAPTVATPPPASQPTATQQPAAVQPQQAQPQAQIQPQPPQQQPTQPQAQPQVAPQPTAQNGAPAAPTTQGQ